MDLLHGAAPPASLRCPCGSGERYAVCCGPLHRGRGSGRVTAATAEALMRSRYSAFAVGDAAYLLASWHPATRPSALELDPAVQWRRLEVLETEAGGPDDVEGVVAFVAHFWDAGAQRRGEQRERSRFARDAGQWSYVGPADPAPAPAPASGEV